MFKYAHSSKYYCGIQLYDIVALTLIHAEISRNNVTNNEKIVAHCLKLADRYMAKRMEMEEEKKKEEG